MGLNPLQQFNPVTVAGMIAIFWVTFAALKVVFFGPLLEVVMARREKLGEAKAKLDEAEAIVADAKAEAETMLTQADAEVEKVLRQTTDDAEDRRQQRIASAKAEVERLLADGRLEVAQVRQSEEAKVRTELVGCTTLACDKLVGKVDKRLVASIVDKVMRARLAT